MRRLALCMLIGVLAISLMGTAPGGTTYRTTYVVQPGDTLLTIAARYGVSVSRLAGANGLSWDSWVYIGQRLTIPGTGWTTYGTTYVVQPGDTLLGIAARYGVSASRLAGANGLRWDSWVYTGQRLTIPAAGWTTYGTTYVVQPGDTLLGIAARYGVSASRLAGANGLRWDSWVYTGQRLTIPGPA